MPKAPQQFTLEQYNKGEHFPANRESHFFNRMGMFRISEKIMKYGGVEVYYREHQIEAPVHLQVTHPKGFLKIQFELSGYSDFTPAPGTRESIPVRIGNGQFNGIFMPYISGQLHYLGDRSCLDLMMTPEYLANITGTGNGLPGDFLRKVGNKQPTLMFEKARDITPDMMRCIRDVIQCPVAKPLRDAFIRHKIAEIVLLVIDQLYKQDTVKVTVPGLSDTERVLRLKQWIDHHLTEDITPETLAYQAGMCQTKLRTLFKELTKKSIMAYVRDQKLAYARTLLLENHYSVQEVASLINYQHSHHFSVAFKRKYGMLPSRV